MGAGVYIPNMSKPKDCSECILADKHLNGLYEAKYYCRLEADSCPLIEIVTCGECKHQVKQWHEDNRRKDKGFYIYWCDRNEDPFVAHTVSGEPTDFCSYGERRADETIESITFKKMVKAVKEEMREVQNIAERRNDGTVCSYGVPANADQHTQRVESVGERRSDETT